MTVSPQPPGSETAAAPWRRWVWLRRAVGLLITVAIFVWICRPIVARWAAVQGRILAMNWGRVLAASVMFSIFLLVFRVTSWRQIVKYLGIRVPFFAAARIWSTSELARYLPGAIWQVVGRAYLARPYGVSLAISSASQLLELLILLLANLLVALGCLLWLGINNVHGAAHNWLIVALCLVPVLLCVLHPRVFYGLIDAIARRGGKPLVKRHLRFVQLLGLLLWAVIGLLWQSLAIWLVTFRLLDLSIGKWWLVAGAYCLAWCAGFLAVWAPAGLGVREVVFIAAMDFALPRAWKSSHLAGAEQTVFLAFLSVVLRLWATIGELILATFTYVMDFRGALGQRRAPPQVPPVSSRLDEARRSPAE